MDADLLLADLRRDEGVRLKPYRCSAGRLTIGIGRNLDANGITAEEAEHLCRNDVALVVAELDKATPWWRSLSEPRQRVLANMAFNLGVKGLLLFRRTLRAVEVGEYDEAARGMRESLWARQVGPRAERLAQMMEGETQ